ncbi:MAG: hypothetical protein E7358_00505 [Clostridiales bacterium]|nr:hypothetical protein [Clostridiales bacterium]
MKGIKLSHGTIFITDGLITVRVLASGQVGVSPVTYNTLEWELQSENPNGWDYLTAGEIESLEKYQEILLVFENTRKLLKI